MKDFLKLLLEGSENSSAEVEEPMTDEATDKEVNESCLPTGLLIESVFTDINASLNIALETYQMACIVGGVQVVSEGMDQEGATAILTEVTNNIFAKIKEGLIKAKNWFVSLVKKIIDGFKSIGKDTATKFKAVEADFDKNFESGKFKYKGSIIDLAVADDLLKSVDKSIKDAISEITSDIDDISKNDSDEADDMGKTLISDPAAFFISEVIDNASGVDLKDAKNQADVVNALKKAMGYESDGGKEIEVSSTEATRMKEVIKYTEKSNCEKERELIKTTSKACDDIVAKLKTVENSNKPNATKWAHAAASMFNFASQLAASLVNTKIKMAAAAAKSYLGWMKQIAAGKGVTEGAEYIEEGFDTMYLFEDAELDDMEEEPIEESSMFANLNSMKEWFGDNSKMMKDLVNEGNSAFASKDYKKAQKCYEQAKKEADAALSSLKRIDNSVWTTVVGWLLLGWYYVILRIIAHVVVKVTAPNTKPNGEYTKKDLEAKRKECESGLRGTQKVVGGVIGEIIAFCDQQIDLCKHPDKISMEGCDFDAEAASLLEEVMALFEDDDKGAEDDPESDDDDDPEKNDEPAEEGTDLIDLAMSFLV